MEREWCGRRVNFTLYVKWEKWILRDMERKWYVRKVNFTLYVKRAKWIQRDMWRMWYGKKVKCAESELHSLCEKNRVNFTFIWRVWNAKNVRVCVSFSCFVLLFFYEWISLVTFHIMNSFQILIWGLLNWHEARR